MFQVRVCMQRYVRPGGVAYDLPVGLLSDIAQFCQGFGFRLLEIQELLDDNRIWKQRLVDIGVVTSAEALSLGLLRCNASWFWSCLGSASSCSL